MNRYYISHATVMHYYKIRINSTLPEDSCNLVFSGKSVDGALKAAQRYCDKSNSKIKYKTLTVGDVIKECDPWGR